EWLSRTLDYIQVTVGHRIKAARINRASHRRKFAEEFRNEKRISGRARRARRLYLAEFPWSATVQQVSWLILRLTKQSPSRARFHRGLSSSSRNPSRCSGSFSLPIIPVTDWKL